MLTLLSAFDDFAHGVDAKEPAIDNDFITDFLLPYFHDLPREAIAAKVAEIIAQDQSRRESALHSRSRRELSSTCCMNEPALPKPLTLHPL